MPGRAEGGQQTYIKGVESASYLRHLESRKFRTHPHGKAVFNVHGLYIPAQVRLARVRPNGFLIIRSDIHNSVGFGIAYPRMVGDARAQGAG